MTCSRRLLLPCRTIAPVFLSALWTLSATAPAMAQSGPAKAPDGWSGSLSVGVGNAPTYEGSPNRRTSFLPGFSIGYRDKTLGAFELGRMGLSWTFIESDKYSLGVFLGADGGRKETKPSNGLLGTLGDSRLAGMGDVKGSAELGIAAGIDFGLPLNITLHKALSSHKGAQIDLGVALPLPITDKLTFNAGVGATLADRKYMAAYFGVTAAQAAASRFTEFTAKAGLRKVDLNLGLDYKLTGPLSVQGGINASRLTSSAAKSPISEKDTQLTVFSSLTYTF